MTPSDSTAAAAIAAQVTEALTMVKALVASGALTAEALGLATPAPPTALPALVPGVRITVRQLAAKAKQGCKPSTLRTYGGYMDLLVDGWPAAAAPEEKIYPGLGDRWADEVLPSDLEEALRFVEARAGLHGHWRAVVREAIGRVVRTSDASGAAYNAVGAWRRLFKVAVQDRHLAKGFDPSQEVDKPRRSAGTRRALEQAHLDEALGFIGSSGDDPELDLMICEAILIAGARQEGILNLTLDGIDLEECAVRLDEKFDKVTWQPVPDWWAHRLYDFAVSRGAGRPGDAVFRKRAAGRRPVRPIGPRRFNYLFERLQLAFAWADKQQVTAHTLRHHAISTIERVSSKAVAVAFARHEPEDTNGRYSKASPREVAHAVVRLHGGDHPWLHREPRPRRA